MTGAATRVVSEADQTALPVREASARDAAVVLAAHPRPIRVVGRAVANGRGRNEAVLEASAEERDAASAEVVLEGPGGVGQVPRVPEQFDHCDYAFAPAVLFPARFAAQYAFIAAI